MNSTLGIALIGLGSICAASFYLPLKKISNLSWANMWIIQGFFAWIIIPLFFGFLTIGKDSLFDIITEAPRSTIYLTVLFGVLWGIGGLTFGLTIRHLGVALGQSLALGLCAAFGTIVPPLFAGENLFASRQGILIIAGVSICLAGIAIIGYAGALKSKNNNLKINPEFAFKKGIIIALVSGIMSACFNYGYQAGKPFESIAQLHGIPALYLKNTSLICILLGGFLTNLIYCSYLIIKDKTFGEFIKMKPSELTLNIGFAMIAGLLWFLQFHFFGMGSSKLPPSLSVMGWSILMALNIAVSNIWGIVLNEWKGSSRRTIVILLAGIIVLICSTFIVSL